MTDRTLQGFLLDRQGNGREVELSTTAPLVLAPETLLWVHIDYSDPVAAAWLRSCNHLDPLAVESLLQESSRPRSMLYHNGLILDLRGVNLNPGAEPEDMVAVRLWADEQCIITSNRRRLLSLEDIREALRRGNGPGSSSAFIGFLLECIDERLALVIEKLEDDFDALEDRMLVEEHGLLRPELSRQRRLAIRLRRYLGPQKDAVGHLLTESPPWLQKTERMRLRESLNRLNRHLEELDAIRDRAIVAQEEFLNRLSEQLNTRMYTLSLVATLFMPLSFLTGLLGINVGGIPGAGSNYGFLAVSLMIAALFSAQLYYLRSKKWF